MIVSTATTMLATVKSLTSSLVDWDEAMAEDYPGNIDASSAALAKDLATVDRTYKDEKKTKTELPATPIDVSRCSILL